MQVEDKPEVKRALRVIRRATRKLEQGKPRDSINIIMQGFGGIMFRKLVENMRKKR